MDRSLEKLIDRVDSLRLKQSIEEIILKVILIMTLESMNCLGVLGSSNRKFIFPNIIQVPRFRGTRDHSAGLANHVGYERCVAID
jgi:hypothetical protein